MNRFYMILALGTLTLALSSCSGGSKTPNGQAGSWNTAIWNTATWQ
ncbi:hypothetical protein LAJ19_01385 [Deinococcus taeanensis]|nr:hypothetical protein [Deinococcus taeanensis]UBV44071.1 hypothetical protein LAJ19_01385 [Deinococcus taeanensis]